MTSRSRPSAGAYIGTSLGSGFVVAGTLVVGIAIGAVAMFHLRDDHPRAAGVMVGSAGGALIAAGAALTRASSDDLIDIERLPADVAEAIKAFVPRNMRRISREQLEHALAEATQLLRQREQYAKQQRETLQRESELREARRQAERAARSQTRGSSPCRCNTEELNALRRRAADLEEALMRERAAQRAPRGRFPPVSPSYPPATPFYPDECLNCGG